MKTKLIVISLLIILASSTLLIEGSDAEPYSVDIVDSTETPIGDTPLVNKLIVFTTWTEDGVTKYMLPEETILSSVTNYYLKITSAVGQFKVTASTLDEDEHQTISGALQATGVKVTLSHIVDNETITYTANLDSDNTFSSLFKLGTEDAVFEPNELYLIKVYTENSYSNQGEYTITTPTETTDLSIRFDATPVAGCVVRFIDNETVISTKLIEKDQPLGELPVPPARESYTFDGWYDNDGKNYTASTIITANVDLYSRWSEEPEPEPPGPDPPGPEPPDHTTVITEETIINDDGSVTEIETITTKYKSGADDV